MRISVVTPSFNMAAYLEETIVSVVRNLAPGDEYFVIDGGSTDGSVEIIRKYQDRITGWVSEPDRGYADAIAKGFERASGDALCWLNAGDLFLAGALDVARATITDQDDLIFGDDFHIDEEGRVLYFSRGWVPDLRSALLFGTWTPLQEACFWSAEVYRRSGGMDRTLDYAADYDLFLRIAQTGRARHVPIAFGAFRRHGDQKSIAGAVSYRTEKFACRERELRREGLSGLRHLPLRALWRIAMSARARLAPWLWHRQDLAGRAIATLSCAQYWPRDV